MADHKRCSKCDETKPIADYSRDKSKRDGRRPSCKACVHQQHAQAYAGGGSERRKAAYHANLEAERERARTYARDNLEAGRERSRRYRAANSVKMNAQAKAWRQANPDKTRINNQRRRAVQRSATVEPFTSQDLAAYWEDLDIYSCFYCLSDVSSYYELDHVVPLSKGGAHSIQNLVPACRECNMSKSAGDPWEFLRHTLSDRGEDLDALVRVLRVTD